MILLLKKKNINKYILILFLFVISLWAWEITLLRPGGDSNLYYTYAKFISDYFQTGVFDKTILNNSNLSFSIPKESLFLHWSSFKLDETMVYIYLSSFLNFILDTNNVIIFLQIILSYITFNSMYRIVKYYNPNYKINYSFFQFFLGLPIFLIAIVPAKESISLFFITILFELFSKKAKLLFFLFFIFFYIYRWNNALIFLMFLVFYIFSNKIFNSKYKKIYYLYLSISIMMVIFIGINFITYFQTGYNVFKIKMLLTVFSFPLLKFPIYDINSINQIINIIWNNIYSLIWYFFLPSFFMSFFNKRNDLKSLSFSLLVVLIFLGCISMGNQLDRIKFLFYTIYIIIGLINFYSVNHKKYLYYFLVILFFNYIQVLNHIYNNFNISLFNIIISPIKIIINFIKGII